MKQSTKDRLLVLVSVSVFVITGTFLVMALSNQDSLSQNGSIVHSATGQTANAGRTTQLNTVTDVVDQAKISGNTAYLDVRELSVETDSFDGVPTGEDYYKVLIPAFQDKYHVRVTAQSADIWSSKNLYTGLTLSVVQGINLSFDPDSSSSY